MIAASNDCLCMNILYLVLYITAISAILSENIVTGTAKKALID